MYEITITFVEVDSKGNDRNRKQNLILEHADRLPMQKKLDMTTAVD